jgi:hypothetical protein
MVDPTIDSLITPGEQPTRIRLRAVKSTMVFMATSSLMWSGQCIYKLGADTPLLNVIADAVAIGIGAIGAGATGAGCVIVVLAVDVIIIVVLAVGVIIIVVLARTVIVIVVLAVEVIVIVVLAVDVIVIVVLAVDVIVIVVLAGTVLVIVCHAVAVIVIVKIVRDPVAIRILDGPGGGAQAVVIQ